MSLNSFWPTGLGAEKEIIKECFETNLTTQQGVRIVWSLLGLKG